MAVRHATLLAALAVASLAIADSVSAKGELEQLPGRQGCLTAERRAPLPRREMPTRRCLQIRGLSTGDFDVEFARGGRTVYISAESEVAVFNRDVRSGSLRQLDGPAGCLTIRVRADCSRVPIADPLDGTSLGLFVPPGSQHAYLGWSSYEEDGGGIAGLSIDPLTGAMTPLAGPGGCLRTDARAGCARLRELTHGAGLTASPDGRHVYGSGYDDRTLVILRRDPATGELAQPEGAAGCISRRVAADCTIISGPFLVTGVSVSPDGKNVYVGTQFFCGDEDLPCMPGSLRAFSRDPATGMLNALPGRAHCYRYRGRGNCTPARAVWDVAGPTITPNGRYVYTHGLDGIAVFRRDRRTGTLAQLRGRSGCLQASRREGCAKLRAMDAPNGFDMAPDGRNAYVGTAFENTTIGVFRRTRRGRLVQLPGTRGCLSRPRHAGCARAHMSRSPYAVSIAPDGRHAYVEGLSVVAAFAVQR